MQPTFWRFTGIFLLPWRIPDNIKSIWMIRRKRIKNNISPIPFWIWYVSVCARISSSTTLLFSFSSPWWNPFISLYTRPATDIQSHHHHLHPPILCEKLLRLSLSFSRAMISIYTLNIVISMMTLGTYVKSIVIDLNGLFFSRNVWQLNQQHLQWLLGHVWNPLLLFHPVMENDSNLKTILSR